MNFSTKIHLGFHIKPALFAGLLCLGLSKPAAADVVDDMKESTVRIIALKSPKQGERGFGGSKIPLLDGRTIASFASGTGTGFIINKEGYIVTNNHVIGAIGVENSELKDYSNEVILVAQKQGAKYFLHRAQVESTHGQGRIAWQSPNADMAILRCPSLKGKPFVLSMHKSKEKDAVFSLGYPAIGDAAVESREKANEVRVKLIELVATERAAKLEDELKRKLTQEEINKLINIVASQIGPFSFEWNALLDALNNRIIKNDLTTAKAMDITDLVASKTLWGAYFAPTLTTGTIEKVTRIPGFLGGSNPDISILQHNCHIMHGNSGGPLLNYGNQVIGVVGRGITKTSSGDLESVSWAMPVTEMKEALAHGKISYKSVWRPYRPTEGSPWKVIIAVSLAVTLALAALVFTVIRSRRVHVGAGGSGLTTVIEDRVRKKMDEMIARQQGNQGTSPPQPGFQHKAPPALPGAPKWVLSGRTPDGRNLRVEIADSLFSGNNYGLIMGRTEELCHFVVNDSSVSKQHARVRRSSDGLLVSDRNSANGTAVNGRFSQKPYEDVPLRGGDTLTLGEVKLQLTRG